MGFGLDDLTRKLTLGCIVFSSSFPIVCSSSCGKEQTEQIKNERVEQKETKPSPIIATPQVAQEKQTKEEPKKEPPKLVIKKEKKEEKEIYRVPKKKKSITVTCSRLETLANKHLRKIAVGKMPVISADGQKVAYSLTKEIYVIDLKDGKKSRIGSNILGEHGEASHPSLSADGSYIAFEGWVRGDFNIYVLKQSGNLTNITASLDDVFISPSISGDGSTIAYMHRKPKAYKDPWQINVTRLKDRKTVTFSTGNPSGSPVDISSDGNKVVFVRKSSTGSRPYDVRWDVIVADLLKNTETNISKRLKGASGAARISADGKKVVFCGGGGYQSKGNLYVADLENQTLTHIITEIRDARKHGLSPKRCNWPCISGDGNRVVFMGTPIGSRHNDVFFVDVDKNKITKISTGQIDDCFPTISLNGKIIAFQSNESVPSNCDVYIATLEEK